MPRSNATATKPADRGTSVYICADGTLTYGPYGGRRKIIPQALPVAVVASEDEALALITTIGRLGWDVPEADPHFEQALAGRSIEPGYGPTRRYYYSGPEFRRNDVESLMPTRQAVEARLAAMRAAHGGAR